jgi:hypothetical protein
MIGFLLGIKHATEADHLAAVATLVTRQHSLAQSMRHGAAWGIGHALTLLLFGGMVLALGASISRHLGLALEIAVGGMLIGLGGNVLYRVVRQQIHVHVHRHPMGGHVHVHSHAARTWAAMRRMITSMGDCRCVRSRWNDTRHGGNGACRPQSGRRNPGPRPGLYRLFASVPSSAWRAFGRHRDSAGLTARGWAALRGLIAPISRSCALGMFIVYRLGVAEALHLGWLDPVA